MRSMVEGLLGQSRLGRFPDRPQNFFQVVAGGGRGETDNLDPLRLQPGRACAVSGQPFRNLMITPVDLDRETGCRAVEVEDVGANGMLAAKLQVGEG